MTLVIVDDYATIRRLLRGKIEAEGHVTLEAGDGIEALEILGREKVDAVVSDILMPRMDGYRLCHEIRMNDRLRKLPFVIYTATYTSASDEKLALSMGADKYLKKPASVETILAAVREAMAAPHSAPRLEARQEVEVLKKYSEALAAKLEERNFELEQRLRLGALSTDVGAALTHGNTLRKILQQCAEAVVQHLDAALARIWTHHEGDNVLELQASAGLYTHIDGPDGRVPVGQSKIGQIAQEQRPLLTNSVIGDPRVPEQEWARREGLAAFAGYPLVIGGRMIGVIAMFSRHRLSEATFGKMNAIADAVALGIERKRKEEELRSADEQLHRLLALSPAVIINLKVEGEKVTPTFISDNMERITGYTVAEALGDGWWMRNLHPEDREAEAARIVSELKSSDGYSCEYRIRHKDGTYRWIMDSNRIRRSATGQPLEITAVWTDISEHKQEEKIRRRLEDTAAQAEASNLAKSTFLSTMSHEIRTPMNAILGYVQLLLRDPKLGTEARANLKIIGRSGEHLLGLINDILDMSKIEAGRMEFHPVDFDLVTLLDDLAAMFRLRAEAKALVFDLVVDGETVPYVLADEAKIRQALINLVGNAIKFTDRGRVGLHVTLELREGEQLWMSASVEDTGPGIKEADQAKLFEPFSQARRGFQSQEGTGLGLAISRKYARLMGGDLKVNSRFGRGSTFRLEIPVERGSAGAAAAGSAPRRVIGLQAGAKAPRVLVVDDHPPNREWLIKLLTCIGFSARGAENGEAAIRGWEEWNPQLILMDIHMPVMDGLEATRRIKADPRGKNTSIVALTASALGEERGAVAQSGADDFLAKPCREHELLEKMRVLLDIAYEYEEASPDGAERVPGASALRADMLGRLPRELCEELRGATLSGNKRLLNQLLSRVRETEDAAIAHGLQQLADKYEYDALTRLLEEACRR